MKINELHQKNVEELNMYLLNLLHEQFRLRIKIKKNNLQQTHMLKKIRRNIARIKTLLIEKASLT